MRIRSLIFVLAVTATLAALGSSVQAGGRTRTIADVKARRIAAQQPWHGPYAHNQFGQPVALVVPPGASMHTEWSWGVSQTRVVPTYPQFNRAYPGADGVSYGEYGPLLRTPAWPSHTDQFGVYPIRGPW